MNENVLARLALDEPKSFGGIEPLYCSLFLFFTGCQMLSESAESYVRRARQNARGSLQTGPERREYFLEISESFGSHKLRTRTIHPFSFR